MMFMILLLVLEKNGVSVFWSSKIGKNQKNTMTPWRSGWKPHKESLEFHQKLGAQRVEIRKVIETGKMLGKGPLGMGAP